MSTVPIFVSDVKKQTLRFDMVSMGCIYAMTVETVSSTNKNLDIQRTGKFFENIMAPLSFEELHSCCDRLTKDIYDAIDASLCKITIKGIYDEVQFTITSQKKSKKRKSNVV